MPPLTHSATPSSPVNSSRRAGANRLTVAPEASASNDG